MPLDKEVGLGPGYIMLDEYLPSTQKGHTPNFRYVCGGRTVAHLSYCWALVLLKIYIFQAMFYDVHLQRLPSYEIKMQNKPSLVTVWKVAFCVQGIQLRVVVLK